jgi:uncharacterized protein (DUF362 family)
MRRLPKIPDAVSCLAQKIGAGREKGDIVHLPQTGDETAGQVDGNQQGDHKQDNDQGGNVMARVSVMRVAERITGVRGALVALAENPVKNKAVLIKPNFNTADPAPGSTHNDTLTALVDQLWEMGAASIRLGERSYTPTRQVMKQKGIVPLLEKRQVQVIDFDDLAPDDWVACQPADAHWKKGFRVARPILETECLVSTGCLKTHQFGGVITLSLKLHVGVVPTFRNGFAYMQELHGSPYQQEMIAEINAPFSPDLIVMDGIDTFVDGGPATGTRIKGNVVMAATDRVAVDAVGVAMLKHLGSNPAVMESKIFDLRQIKRAAELGIGVRSASAIDLVAADAGSAELSTALGEILSRG